MKIKHETSSHSARKDSRSTAQASDYGVLKSWIETGLHQHFGSDAKPSPQQRPAVIHLPGPGVTIKA